MILLDANLLIYAYNRDMPTHSAARQWLDWQLGGRSSVALPWPSLLAFVRIVSNPKVFPQSSSVAEAWDQVERWLTSPSAWVPSPTKRHAEVLGRLLGQPGIQTKSVPDAHLAALAIEHDLILCSTDKGFDQFRGLRWRNPLGSKA